MMRAADGLELVGIARGVGVAAWLDGGWGIEALLGSECRSHGDVDLVTALADVDRLTVALAPHGYVTAEDHPPIRRVLRGRGGDGRQVGGRPDGGDCVYPATGFVTGTVVGVSVPCISADVQLVHHLGYVPRPHDIEDMQRLAARFGLALPDHYAASTTSREHHTSENTE